MPTANTRAWPAPRTPDLPVAAARPLTAPAAAGLPRMNLIVGSTHAVHALVRAEVVDACRVWSERRTCPLMAEAR